MNNSKWRRKVCKYRGISYDVGMLDKAIKLYEQGHTQSEVAKTLDTTQKVIWGLFRKANYKCRIAKKSNQTGENNDTWKGNRAGYAALHYRVQKLRGTPSKCSMCDTELAKRFEWANVTGNYSNVYDYVRLCKSCHSKFDNVIINIIGERL
jgi:hypothetical protein